MEEPHRKFSSRYEKRLLTLSDETEGAHDSFEEEKIVGRWTKSCSSRSSQTFTGQKKMKFEIIKTKKKERTKNMD